MEKELEKEHECENVRTMQDREHHLYGKPQKRWFPKVPLDLATCKSQNLARVVLEQQATWRGWNRSRGGVKSLDEFGSGGKPGRSWLLKGRSGQPPAVPSVHS